MSAFATMPSCQASTNCGRGSTRSRPELLERPRFARRPSIHEPRHDSKRPASRWPTGSCCCVPISTTSACATPSTAPIGSTRPMRRHHFVAAAEVDRAAFGPGWGHDARELIEICRATPVHAARQRVATPRRFRCPRPRRPDRLRHRRGVVGTRLPPALVGRSERPTLWPRPGADHRRPALDDPTAPPRLSRQYLGRQLGGARLVPLDRLPADGRATHRSAGRPALTSMSSAALGHVLRRRSACS